MLRSFFLVCLMLPVLTHAHAAPEKITDKPLFHIDADGEIKVQPNTAWLTLTFEETQKTAALATQRCAQQVSIVTQQLKSAGILAQHIQTADLRVQPVVEYNPGNGKSKITGYQATHTLVIEMDIQKISTVFDVAMNSNSASSQGIRYGVKESKPYEKQALTMAYHNAQEKALLLAQAAGYQRVRLINIDIAPSSASFNTPRPMMMMKAMAAEAAPSTPVFEGETSMTAHIRATFVAE